MSVVRLQKIQSSCEDPTTSRRTLMDAECDSIGVASRLDFIFQDMVSFENDRKHLNLKKTTLTFCRSALSLSSLKKKKKKRNKLNIYYTLIFLSLWKVVSDFKPLFCLKFISAQISKTKLAQLTHPPNLFQ